jgi:hypothetical protein
MRTLFNSGSGAAASEDVQVINREAINEAAPQAQVNPTLSANVRSALESGHLSTR